MVSSAFSFSPGKGGGGEGTPYSGYAQVYKAVDISQVEEYERVGKSVI